MADSFNEVGAKAEGDTISIPFGYTSRDHVYVVVDGEDVSSTLYSWASGSTLLCLAGFPEGTTARVERRSPVDELPAEQQGSGTFDYEGANSNDRHLLYIAQERKDLEDTVISSAAQVAADLVTTSAKADEAVAAAATATTKAGEASASASAASSSASTASSAATTATTKAGEAAASASTASSAATTATTKAAEAAADAANLDAAMTAFQDFMFLADWGSITDTPGTTTDYGDLSA